LGRRRPCGYGVCGDLTLEPDARVWWRVAYSRGPLKFPAKKTRRWTGRFDDPLRDYRTLYCAADRLTCFYEVLAPFRPDVAVHGERLAIQLPLPFVDVAIEQERRLIPLSRSWRSKHVLVPVRIHLAQGTFLVDLGRVPVRERIFHDYRHLMSGVRRLDRNVIAGEERELTQMLSRLVYEEGAAGILYPSKLDGLCVALFEHRSRLVATGRRELLTEDIPEFLTACSHLHIPLDP
jgi:RES domain-containing protein